LSADKLDNIELKTQKQKIDRDLLYVALTRAMNNLYVLGQKNLSDILTMQNGCCYDSL